MIMSQINRVKKKTKGISKLLENDEPDPLGELKSEGNFSKLWNAAVDKSLGVVVGLGLEVIAIGATNDIICS